MKKDSVLLLTVGFLALAMSALSAHDPQRNSGHRLSISDNSSDKTSFSCSGRQQMFSDEYDGYAKTEVNQQLPNSPLKVKAAHNGGIQVFGYDGAQINVKVCIAAAARTDSEAMSLAKSVNVNGGNGEVNVVGPEKSGGYFDGDRGYWTATILIQTPRNADLNLSSYNGGVSLYQYKGTAYAQTTNGGISLNQSSGKIIAEAQNGGITIKECSGDVQANVQNGGITVNLPQHWEGTGLEAHTHNGGMTVIVPKDMQSGVEVKSGRWSRIRCNSVCDGMKKDWDDESNSVRFGTGTTLVHLSTVNGGVQISDRSWKDMED